MDRDPPWGRGPRSSLGGGGTAAGRGAGTDVICSAAGRHRRRLSHAAARRSVWCDRGVASSCQRSGRDVGARHCAVLLRGRACRRYRCAQDGEVACRPAIHGPDDRSVPDPTTRVARYRRVAPAQGPRQVDPPSVLALSHASPHRRSRPAPHPRRRCRWGLARASGSRTSGGTSARTSI
jgi:hypothetical protein